MKLFRRSGATRAWYDRNTVWDNLDLSAIALPVSWAEIGSLFTVRANRRARIGLFNGTVITQQSVSSSKSFRVGFGVNQVGVGLDSRIILIDKYNYIDEVFNFSVKLDIILSEGDTIAIYGYAESVSSQPDLTALLSIMTYEE